MNVRFTFYIFLQPWLYFFFFSRTEYWWRASKANQSQQDLSDTVKSLTPYHHVVVKLHSYWSASDGLGLWLWPEVFPLPGHPAKNWPLLLVLSPHGAKCYLWCHICPGKWSKLQRPSELVATIPGDCLPNTPTHTHTHAEDCQQEAVWYCSHKNNSLCG